MAYTYKSLAFLWLVILGLFVLVVSGVVAGSGILLLLLIALGAPALILRTPVDRAVASRERRSPVAAGRERSPSDFPGIDVSRWENEGGAQRMRVSLARAEPAPAAP